MEETEYKQNAGIMLYLVSCAVSGKTPDAERLKSVDLSALFQVCQKHILTACTAYALESAGIREEQFTQAKEKAIRKNVLLDTERKKILSKLEEAKIWYMPLKGSILKDWYPRLGMRQMSDNDILCDSTRMKDIRSIMKEMGYNCEHFGREHNDAYSKPPVLYFEMHRCLFSEIQIDSLYKYYADVKTRLLPDTEGGCGYHFRDEDFYLYFLAHEYKHFAHGGTGVRSLVDTYIILRKLGDSFDRDYLRAELDKLAITDFERQNRELAYKVMEQQPLTAEEQKLLDYYILSGTYGSVANDVAHKMEEQAGGSKLRYLFRRLFPPMELYRVGYPWACRHKILLPVAWFCRLFRIFRYRKKVQAELRYLQSSGKQSQ